MHVMQPVTSATVHTVLHTQRTGPAQPIMKRVARGTSRVRYGSFISQTYTYTGPGLKLSQNASFEGLLIF